jgi:hypothetical protein
LFLTVLEAGKSKIKGLASGEGFLAMLSMVEGGRARWCTYERKREEKGTKLILLSGNHSSKKKSVNPFT